MPESRSTTLGAPSEPTPSNESVLVSKVLPPLATKSRRIYLIRHGETDWNVKGKIQGGGHDIPLNDNGRSQALAAAMALEDIPLTALASSPLSRAKETADILWKRHSSTIEDRRLEFDGFAEMRFGEFEGLAYRDESVDQSVRDHFRKVAGDVKHDVNLAFPGGGESTADVQARSTEALQKVLDSYPNESHIAIVSHGRTNKVIIATTALSDISKFPEVKQSNTCINVMDIGSDGKWTPQCLNYFEHVKDNVILRLP